VSLLASKSLGFRDGNALETNLLQRFFHFVEFERFDDRFDLFHVQASLHGKVWPYTSRWRASFEVCPFAVDIRAIAEQSARVRHRNRVPAMNLSAEYGANLGGMPN
jgi:hypothetical protein